MFRTRYLLAGWVAVGLLAAGFPAAGHDGDIDPTARTATKASFAGASKFDAKSAYTYSQSAIGRKIGGYSFVSTTGQPVSLEQFRGSPLIISMVYSSCHRTCPLITQNLLEAVEDARDALGDRNFNVVSVGFDTFNDTPAAMARFASRQGIEGERWTVLSGGADGVERLAADAGFIYFSSAKGFDHLNQTTLVDADGTVHTQIYGQDFDPTRLTEPLKQLLLGRAKSLSSFDSLLNQVVLFCTIYDPYAGKYRFDYSFFIGMFLSAVVLVLMGNFVVRNIWRVWRQPADDVISKS